MQILKIGFLLLLGTGCAVAQSNWETTFNTKTGNIESQYNPWNDDNLRYESRQRDRQFQDMCMRNRMEENRLRSESMRQLSLQLYQEVVARSKAGQALIQAGQASTTFRVDPHFSLKEYLLKKATTPELKSKIEESALPCLSLFRSEVRARHLSENDIADGQALAFGLAYETFFGNKVDAEQLQWIRDKGRQGLLKSAYFQGGSALERQQQYELYGALTMYARAHPGTEEAKGIAKEVLQLVWSNSTDTILMTPHGFKHKGNQIIADGQASHLFRLDPNFSTASRFAEGGKVSNMATVYQANLDDYYREMARMGGRKDDLASHAALCAYAAYAVLSDGQRWSPKQYASVYEFAKKAILKSPDIQAAPAQNKQLAVEILAIRSTEMYRGYLQGSGARKEEARLLLRELFGALGEDLNSYTWDASGIVRVPGK